VSQEQRVKRLEEKAQGDQEYRLVVDWGDGDAPELKPGDRLVEWGEDDQLTVTKVTRDD